MADGSLQTARANRTWWLFFGFGVVGWLLWATVLALVLLGVPGETTRGDWIFAINTYLVCPIAFLLVARCLLIHQMDLVTMGVGFETPDQHLERLSQGRQALAEL